MFDTEKFIREVEKRPAIYDTNSKEYGNRDLKTACWEEIGAIMYRNWYELSASDESYKVKELVKKWKAVRDCFVKDIKKQCHTTSGEPASKKKRYVYCDQLQFLLPFLSEGRETGTPITPIVKLEEMSNNNIEACEPAKEAETKTDVETRDAGKQRNKSRLVGTRQAKIDNILMNAAKKFTDIISESMTSQKEEASDRFGNRAFLLSFLPIMDRLPTNLQLDARLKMAQVFKEVTAGDVSSTAKHSNVTNVCIIQP